MNVYCIEQYAYNEDTNTYNICKGVVEVFSERVEALRFIDTLDEVDKEDGYDFSYSIKTFKLQVVLDREVSLMDASLYLLKQVSLFS